MTLRVRCYAGASYPERPIAFEWEDRWIMVADVLRRARTPVGLVFDVLADDGEQYRLRWAEANDDWGLDRIGGRLGIDDSDV